MYKGEKIEIFKIMYILKDSSFISGDKIYKKGGV
jgi:hypothetical protein